MSRLKSPYRGLARRNFWRSAVRTDGREALPGLFEPKFEINKTMSIATAGSCFAQHIARHLRINGFDILDAEPAPLGWSDELARSYGYGIYSARYGNIYTARMLRQLVAECFEGACFEDIVWERDGRYFDARRPSIEPEGFDSIEELFALRKAHIAAVRKLFLSCNLFVFTLGLTEGWVSAQGTAFAVAPGAIAGDYDPATCKFVQHRYSDIHDDLLTALSLLRRVNPSLKVILTVSPVPLTATAGQHHVLMATTYSKSVLRAIAGDISQDTDFVDYFPSYEIITGSYSRGRYFNENLSEVTAEGVAAVMTRFSAAYGIEQSIQSHVDGSESQAVASNESEIAESHELVCEEILLNSFAPEREK